MSFVIPNSNQFSTGVPGAYYTPSDLTVFAPGNDLPSTQSSDIQPDDTIVMRLMLRRNPFTTDTKPKGYIKPQRLLDLSYEKQIQFTQSLNQNKLESWYGASDSDIKAVTSYLELHNAQDISVNNEQRTVEFVISYENLRQAFMSEQPEMLFNLSGGQSFYYNPNNYADSYLHSSGEGAEAFAKAIIGSQIMGAIPPKATNRVKSEATGEQGYNYYPSEIADIYNFPSMRESAGGKGVTIGLVGTGGNMYDLLNQNNAFDRYLKNQGINTSKLGKVTSPNNSNGDFGESGMDYSIIRSIAPYANLIVSNEGFLYDSYSELIYDDRIDIISSSLSDIIPTNAYLTKSYNELFLDAALRGKTIVASAGDQGSGNYINLLLPTGKSTPWITNGDPSILSVGGTAFPKGAQEIVDPRPNTIESPYSPPKTYSRKQIDAITGIIDQQTTWNEYDFISNTIPIRTEAIYPTLRDQFTSTDFIGGTFSQYLFANVAGSSSAFPTSALAMPSYQYNNLPKQWRGTGRRYPDISVLAGGNLQGNIDSNYYVFNLSDSGKPELVGSGGTSAGAPLITGLLARATSYLRKQHGSEARLGMINPLLYEQYSSRRKQAFIDVPAGSNNASVFTVAQSPSEWSGYFGLLPENDENIFPYYVLPLNGTGPNGSLNENLSKTGKGFDAATGLGSLNGQGLLDGLTNVWANL